MLQPPEIIERRVSSVRRLTLGVFPIEKHLPLTPGQVEWAVPEKQTDHKILERMRLKLAREVVSNTDTYGLGDSIMELRPALAFARVKSDIKHTILIPSALGTIKDWNIPSNVELMSVFDPAALTDKRNFFMMFSPTYSSWLSFIDKQGLPKVHNFGYGDTPDNVSDAHTTNMRNVDDIAKILRLDLRDCPYNLSDARYAIQLHLLGIDTTADALSQPLLKPHPQPKEYDLLIAPDAKEGYVPHKDQSSKSISPELWLDVFRLLPKNQQIGIIQGTAHGEYCQTVFKQAVDAGLEPRLVVTPTLNDFYQQVCRAKKFVGMDSGTTHIAAEVARANTDIAIREIFNGEIVDVHEYGIRGLGERGQILHCRDQNLSITKAMENIPPKTVAEFIMQ